MEMEHMFVAWRVRAPLPSFCCNLKAHLGALALPPMRRTANQTHQLCVREQVGAVAAPLPLPVASFVGETIWQMVRVTS